MIVIITKMRTMPRSCLECDYHRYAADQCRAVPEGKYGGGRQLDMKQERPAWCPLLNNR
jgi:hypothetical protein